MNADDIATLPAGTRVRMTLDGQVVAQGRGRAGSPGPTIKLEHGPIDSSHYMARESRPSGALMQFEAILSYAQSVDLIEAAAESPWRNGDVVSVESAEADDWSVMARRRGTWLSLITGDLGEHCTDDLITHRARRGEVELLVRSGQPLEKATAAAAAAAVAGR